MHKLRLKKTPYEHIDVHVNLFAVTTFMHENNVTWPWTSCEHIDIHVNPFAVTTYMHENNVTWP